MTLERSMKHNLVGTLYQPETLVKSQHLDPLSSGVHLSGMYSACSVNQKDI